MRLKNYYNTLRLSLKLFRINYTITQIHKANGVKMNNATLNRLNGIKTDVINALESDKSGSYLITVPDIGIRDFIYADPLFKNFYSNRVSFKEKKNNKNKLWLCLIERL